MTLFELVQHQDTDGPQDALASGPSPDTHNEPGDMAFQDMAFQGVFAKAYTVTL